MNKFVGIIAFVLVLAGSASTAAGAMFGASEFYLDNGLRVIVIPNHKAPIVRQMVWYKTGSADEKPGQGGVAHLLEHLMFRGTRKVGHDAYNRITQVNGVDGNAFTSQDFTVYHQSMDISRLELAMFLEADRMHNLDLSRENFELERDIVYQERKQVVENNPAAAFGENLRRLLWGEHPYGRPVTGMPEEIRNLKLEDVRAFYQSYYAPNNAILILAGDIEPETAKVLAEKYYGGISRGEVSKPTFFPEIRDKNAVRLEMNLPRINSVRLVNTWIAPAFNQEKEEIYNLAVLSKYLGEGETSKLYKKLVKEKNLALAVESAYDYGGRSYGTFSIWAIPQSGVSAVKLQKGLEQAVAEAVTEIDAETIENTKQKMRAGLVYLRDNPNEAAMVAGSMAAADMRLEDIEDYGDRISAVRAKDVKQAAQKLLRQSARVSGVLQPVEEKK